MENRKRLFKAGPHDNPTLTDRVKDIKSKRQNNRFDKFSAARQISLDESPGTPSKTRATKKVSEIVDRNQKLKAYRLAKNTKKWNEIQEQRSPFIAAVPSGRWVEKKERFPMFKAQLNDTPVRTALISERVLKKSTVKALIAKSTAKKENVMFFGKSKQKEEAPKSKKRILSELNSVVENNHIEVDLNSTFEMLPSIEDEAEPTPRLRRSNSLPEFVPHTSVVKIPKALTPPVKKIARKEPLRKVAPKVLAKIAKVVKPTVPVKPSATPKRLMSPLKKVQLKKIVKKVESKKPQIDAQSSLELQSGADFVPVPDVIAEEKTTKPVMRSKEALKKVVAKAAMPEQELAMMPMEPEVKTKKPSRAAKPKEPEHSYTYQLYKSSLDIQVSYLTGQIKNLSVNTETFIDLLTENDQTLLHKTVQQGNQVVNEKLHKFGEFLESFEAARNDECNSKRTTDDDVEDYWFLVYDEIEKLKEALSTIQKVKSNALAIVASQKKRRTRRTYLPDEGTPKRSRRIADKFDTPNHNTSCYGCVTMSGTKINTPKSTKRRTTMKKSVLFENVGSTPKRSETRPSSKKHAATPKRNLVRMNAIEADDHELDIQEML